MWKSLFSRSKPRKPSKAELVRQRRRDETAKIQARYATLAERYQTTDLTSVEGGELQVIYISLGVDDLEAGYAFTVDATKQVEGLQVGMSVWLCDEYLVVFGAKVVAVVDGKWKLELLT